MVYQFLELELCRPEIQTCEDPLHSSLTCLQFSHSFIIRNKQLAVDGRSEGGQTAWDRWCRTRARWRGRTCAGLSCEEPLPWVYVIRSRRFAMLDKEICRAASEWGQSDDDFRLPVHGVASSRPFAREWISNHSRNDMCIHIGHCRNRWVTCEARKVSFDAVSLGNMKTTLILRHFVHSEDAKATVDDDESSLICFANQSASESSWMHHRDPNQGHDLSHIALTSPYSEDIHISLNSLQMFEHPQSTVHHHSKSIYSKLFIHSHSHTCQRQCPLVSSKQKSPPDLLWLHALYI